MQVRSNTVPILENKIFFKRRNFFTPSCFFMLHWVLLKTDSIRNEMSKAKHNHHTSQELVSKSFSNKLVVFRTLLLHDNQTGSASADVPIMNKFLPIGIITAVFVTCALPFVVDGKFVCFFFPPDRLFVRVSHMESRITHRRRY